jgi:hypothetical protein
MLRFFFSLALVTLSLIAPAYATTFVWPSTQCNTTLQACINMAVLGDDVQVAQLADVVEPPQWRQFSTGLRQSAVWQISDGRTGLQRRRQRKVNCDAQLECDGFSWHL